MKFRRRSQPRNRPPQESDSLDEEFQRNPREELRSAQKKTMNLLSRRNYSPFELSEKLKASFGAETVEQTLQWAHDQKWFPSESELVERTTELLLQRRKGSQYIAQHLKQRGLEPQKISFEREYEVARDLAESKWKTLSQKLDLNQEQDKNSKNKAKEKLYRFLLQRGFPLDVVRKVVHEKLTS